MGISSKQLTHKWKILKGLKLNKYKWYIFNFKIDFFDFNEFLLLCTDKNMILGFFKDDGTYDQNRLLTSSNDECIKWANDLFENFKKENM